ncbi:DNA internalization-related competence protein ComEC/Rec2 [Anaerocolumna sp.]|uniref:DNA internalization-related competence protein ComEC/Rec2 n=1 Tax=Anaerocolumna sp. TaxID=2041569 RepID=UPI0028A5B5E8|nr:DNA internalization-related competence protein ComEC/Rec2 [Anaerocolumna sp.]
MNIRRPLVWLLTFYIAGIALYKVGGISIVVITILICTLVLWRLLLPKCKRRERLSNFGFALGFPILFILGYSIMNYQLKPNEMDQIFTDNIKGIVYGKLQMLEDKGDYVVLTLTDNVIDLNSDHIKNNLNEVLLNKNKANNSIKEDVLYHSNKIKVYTSENSKFKIGNILAVSGKIEKFQKATNSGQFNEYEYNKIQWIDFKVKAEKVKVINSSYSWFYQRLYEIKNRFIQIYEQILPQKDAGLISAMILGDTSSLDKDIKNLYKENGISHILAISGLNVSLIGMSLFYLLRRLRIPNFIATLLSIFLIFSFGVLTNFSVSTNRAVVMLIIFMWGGVIGRTYDLLSAASLSALIILIQSPMEIYNAGFLLSFSAILGMALLYPIFKNMIGKKYKLAEAFLLTLSIQIITLPVMLYFFYEIPLYSIIINLIILPLSSLIVLISLVAGMVGLIAIPLGLFIIGGVHYILNFYEIVCRFGEKLPGRMILVGRPDLWLLAFYYFILIVWILLNTEVLRKKTIVLLSFLLLIFIKSKNVDLEVTFIDVGQGDCIFMKSPENVTYLIDGGSSDVKEVGKYRIEPFLKSKGVWKLDYVILTHLDTDHISGVLELMENSKNGGYEGNIVMGHLILPNVQEKDQEYMDIVTLAESKGIKVLYIQKGDVIKENHVTMTCLNPSSDTLHADNAASVVLSVNYGDFDLLLTGDLEGEGERQVLSILNSTSSLLPPQDKDTDEILSEPIEVIKDYDVLKVAHHGSKNSTYEPFLSLTRPELALISCGRNNRYGHPSPETLKRLEDAGSETMITYESGAVTISTDGKKMEVKGFLVNF